MTADLSGDNRPYLRNGRYRIDPSTSEARIVFTRALHLGGIGATMTMMDGEIFIADRSSDTRGHLIIDATTLRTDSSSFTAHLLDSPNLDVTNHPRILISSIDAGQAGDRRTVTAVIGLRGIHGVVTLAARCLGARRNTVRLRGDLNLNDYDLRPRYHGPVRQRAELILTLQLLPD
ncbi:YceI family protein [Micromonospora sp. NPDC000089]|uniref:YceI family protein n=1 Tax=unclassified Micromonospora TaxID=2617518 RepID=UPI0036C590E7